MPQTFFFYDLETSGLNPRSDRIMQFAGQRTDLNLNPIDEPFSCFLKFPNDTLPTVNATKTTKITPQMTQADGFLEAEFCDFVQKTFFTPNTISVGYNNIRFDNEFMRFLFWRNFHDPYTWQWQDGRSNWDLLDIVRLTRALRPDGINWPSTEAGKPTNRLELITKANRIEHQHAHDAMADVTATIDVARLIKTNQPKLWDFLFSHRDKNSISSIVNLSDPQPFVYASGRYDPTHNYTTVAFPLASAEHHNLLVYDLRTDPEDYLDALQNFLAHSIKTSLKKIDQTITNNSKNPLNSPTIKILKTNHCPAVAPLSVLSVNNGWKRLNLTPKIIQTNLAKLQKYPKIIELYQSAIKTREPLPPATDPETRLYDNFLSDADQTAAAKIRQAEALDLKNLSPNFQDNRLPELFLRFRARNFPETLTEREKQTFETYRQARLKNQAPRFLADLQSYANEPDHDDFLLTELQLWYQSVWPEF